MTSARFDLRGQDFLNDPAPLLARMQQAGPMVRVRVPVLGTIWMTTTDAAARQLLKDNENFSRDPARAGQRSLDKLFWWMPGFMAPLMQNMIAKDGAEHARLRRIVDQAFARTEIEQMRPKMRTMAEHLLDELPTDTNVDLIATYARQLPLLVICELLGLPPQNREQVTRLIAPISGPTSTWNMLRALPKLRQLMRHLRDDFATVRTTPRPGLISDLVQMEGERLSEDELLAMVFTLFVAGHETTVHLIGDLILALLDRPDIRADLRADWSRSGLSVEEAMRYYSPVMMTKAHFATRDQDFLGQKLKRGEMASAFLIAANHDPSRHDAPAQFRAHRQPNAHLGFGFGPHICLGMQLARAEAQIALETLFTRFPDLTLSTDRASLKWNPRLGIRGLSHLPVRLNP